MVQYSHIRNSVLLALFWICATASFSAQAEMSPQDHITALKANMAASKTALHHYQWIETTTVSMKGEVKATTVKRCYYDVTGTLQKVEESQTSASAPKRGIRGRIAANKKEELTTYMQSAVALIKTYVPPEPAKLQAVKDAGHAAMQPDAGGAGVRLTFSNYEKTGDSLSIDLDPANNQMKGVKVASYLDDPADAVSLNVVMSALPDGTVHAANTTLNAPAKQLSVTVNNDGYQKVSN